MISSPFIVRHYTPCRLMAYIETSKANDALVTGVNDGDNPFQEKKSCVIL